MDDLFRELFVRHSSALLVIDEDERIVEANPAAEEVFGRSRAQLIGQPCYRATHGHDAPCWQLHPGACPTRQAREQHTRVHAVHRHAGSQRTIVHDVVATPLSGLPERSWVLEEFHPAFQELRGIVTICMTCKQVQDEAGEWHAVESYIADHSDAQLSHGLCTTCLSRQLEEA